MKFISSFVGWSKGGGWDRASMRTQKAGPCLDPKLHHKRWNVAIWLSKSAELASVDGPQSFQIVRSPGSQLGGLREVLIRLLALPEAKEKDR